MRILLFFLSTFITISLFGNKRPSIAVIKAQLDATMEDSTKVNLLHDLAFKYSMKNMDSSVYFLQQAIDIADRAHFIEGKLKSLYRLSRLYQVKRNLPAQKKIIAQIASLAQTPETAHWMGKVYWTYGDFARDQAQFDSAQHYYYKSIDHIATHESEYATWLLYTELGAIYSSMDQQERATNSYEKAVALTNTNTTFGYRLIKAFTEKLEGELSIKSNNGTQITLYFKDYKIAA